MFTSPIREIAFIVCVVFFVLPNAAKATVIVRDDSGDTFSNGVWTLHYLVEVSGQPLQTGDGFVIYNAQCASAQFKESSANFTTSFGVAHNALESTNSALKIGRQHKIQSMVDNAADDTTTSNPQAVVDDDAGDNAQFMSTGTAVGTYHLTVTTTSGQSDGPLMGVFGSVAAGVTKTPGVTTPVFETASGVVTIPPSNDLRDYIIDLVKAFTVELSTYQKVLR
jgi:hypothetical protein